jgi:hypothetical protein
MAKKQEKKPSAREKMALLAAKTMQNAAELGYVRPQTPPEEPVERPKSPEFVIVETALASVEGKYVLTDAEAKVLVDAFNQVFQDKQRCHTCPGVVRMVLTRLRGYYNREKDGQK